MKTKHSFMILATMFAVSIFTSCEKDPASEEHIPEVPSKPEVPKVEKPVYKLSTTDEVFYTIHGYNDKIELYKTATSVSQSNPKYTEDVTEICKHMSDSINAKVDILSDGFQKGNLRVPNVGIILNGTKFEYQLCMSGANKDGYTIMTGDYHDKLSRDSLLSLFTSGNVFGFYTTFKDYQNIQIIIQSDVELTDGNSLHMYLAGTDYSSPLMVPLSSMKVYETGTTSTYNKEYKLVYDRFHNRIYTSSNGDIYKTLITKKAPKNIEEFDTSAIIPDYTQISFSAVAPVVQLYKNDKLYIEAVIIKSTEEWDNGFEDGKIRTDIEFRSFTAKDGNYIEMSFQAYYGRQFQIRTLDFRKPVSDASFTTVSNEMINIVDDMKENGKPTLSFVEE